MPSPQDVNMQVRDGLPAILASVDHCSKPSVGDSLLLGNPSREAQQRAEQRVVVGDGQRVDMFPGDHENVERCLWIDVAESDRILGLRDERSRYVTAGDSAEQTLTRHETSPDWYDQALRER